MNGAWPQLDGNTLLLSIAVMGALTAAMAWSAAGRAPGYGNAMRVWAASMLCSGMACLLFMLRGRLPWLLSFGVANALLVLSFLMAAQSSARLLRVRWVQAPALAAALVGWAGILAECLGGAPRAWAISGVSASIGVNALLQAAMVARPGRVVRQATDLVAAFVTACAGLAFLSRAAWAWSADAMQMAPDSSSPPHGALLLAAAAYIAGSTLGFMAMVHQRQRSDIEDAAQRDGLTGLLNRTAFFRHADAHVAARGEAAFAVVMVDIDHFKGVNDRWGHAAGDLVLADAARVIASATRLSDLAGRYGGEEFCILLKDCSPQDAAGFAERLVRSARDRAVRLPDGSSVGYTLSAGAATSHGYEQRVQGVLQALLARADAALYRAKAAGRDRAIAAA